MTEASDVLLAGDPRLRLVAEPCGEVDQALRDDLQRMRRSLVNFRVRNGWGRALAAPQIGAARRAIVCEVGDNLAALLDPEIVWRSAERVIVWDDCFSLPGVTAPVVRHASVSVRYMDETGRARRMERLEPALAELVQHEIDHLDGVLFVDRIVSPAFVVAREHKVSAAKTHAEALRKFLA